MTIREEFEKREHSFMAPYGCQSSESRGRQREEDQCPIRTCFQRDRDRIVFSNGFRRLKYKTQVFLSPLGDDYRTRLTHTLEVSEMARNMARAMRLNEDLAEAIALGHDLGHTPFGHGGEAVLKEIFSKDFSHNEQSLRLVDLLENNGMGLNLTFEVRDGIVKHSKGWGDIITDKPESNAVTVEGRIVRIADIMAYLNHDLDDAIRSEVITRDQVPESCANVLGKNHSERATTMIRDVVYSSVVKGDTIELKIGREVSDAMSDLRLFLFEKVYRSHKVHKEFEKATKIVRELYYHFLENKNALEEQLMVNNITGINNGAPIERVVCDLISMITDRNALALYKKIFFPSPTI